jgi:hypothetical protein
LNFLDFRLHGIDEKGEFDAFKRSSQSISIGSLGFLKNEESVEKDDVTGDK